MPVLVLVLQGLVLVLCLVGPVLGTGGSGPLPQPGLRDDHEEARSPRHQQVTTLLGHRLCLVLVFEDLVLVLRLVGRPLLGRYRTVFMLGLQM